MRLLAFNGFSGESDATCVPMQSPSISVGMRDCRRHQGQRVREGNGTLEVDRQQHQVKKEDIFVRLAVSVCVDVFCTAGVTHEI